MTETPESAAIPPQAITDAAKRIHVASCAVCTPPGDPSKCDGEPYEDEILLATLALEATAPHLAAAERERCAQLADEVGASYLGAPDDADHDARILLFADLLRQGGLGGGT